MSIKETAGHRWSVLACVCLSFIIGVLRLGPAFWAPSQYLVGGWGHPDNLGNHWLLVWVAERVLAGESLLHNTQYYLPVGDHPWLAGNGSEGFLFLPFYALLGWPVGTVPLVLLYFIGIGLGGYVISVAAGAGRAASLIGSVVLTASGFWVREMNAGRFSQLDGMWLLLSLGLFIGLCVKKRSAVWTLGCGLCVGLTGVFYWYYAYFFVLSASIVVLSALVCRFSIQWRQVLQAAAISLVTISLLAMVYWQNWDLVPGVDEGVFPAPDAYADAMTLSGAWLVPFGRTAGAVQSVPTLLLSVLTCVRFRHWSQKQRWGMLMALILCLAFGLLAFGPKTPFFQLVYGWSEPLRRFWWPSRHLILWTVGFSILSSLGGKYLVDRFSNSKQLWMAIGLSALIPFSLWVQGDRPFHANHTPVEHPVEEYLPIADIDGDGIIMPPINPRIANTQLPLLLQLTHKKRLLTGHGMWVDRVRPDAWDEFVSENALLQALLDYELGDSAQVLITSSDIEELQVNGMDLIVLDAKLFPRPMAGLVPNLAKVYTQLFGQPVHRGDQIRVWNIRNWTGTTTIDFPAWSLPPNLTLGNGRHKMPNPVVGRGIQ